MSALCKISLVYLLSSNAETLSIEEATWDKDDWKIAKAPSVSDLGPVLDSRWDDLEISNHKVFQLVATTSFSVQKANTLDFYIRGKKRSKHLLGMQRESSSESWNNYTVVLHNTLCYIFKNNNIIKTVKTTEINPYKIVIKTPNSTLWKIHNYKLRLASHVSQQLSILTIPPSGRNNIFLYTSMCQNCILNISVLIHNSNVESYVIGPTRNGKKVKEPILNFWKETIINVDPNKETKIVYNRSVTPGNTDNMIWGIDYKLGPYRKQEIEHTQEIIIAVAVIIGLTISICIGFGLYVRKRRIKKGPDVQDVLLDVETS